MICAMKSFEAKWQSSVWSVTTMWRRIMTSCKASKYYQACIWGRCLERSPDVPNPDGHGWVINQENIEVSWISCPPAPDAILEFISCKCKKSPHHLLVLAWRTTLNALLHVIFLTATTRLLKDTNQTIQMNIVRIIPNSYFVLSTCNGLLSFLENFERCMNVPCDLYKCILLINRMSPCMKLHVCFMGRGWGTEP